MPTDHRAKLAAIKRFDQLIAYLAETGRHAEHLDAVREYRSAYGA